MHKTVLPKKHFETRAALIFFHLTFGKTGSVFPKKSLERPLHLPVSKCGLHPICPIVQATNNPTTFISQHKSRYRVPASSAHADMQLLKKKSFTPLSPKDSVSYALFTPANCSNTPTVVSGTPDALMSSQEFLSHQPLLLRSILEQTFAIQLPLNLSSPASHPLSTPSVH